MLSVLPDVVNKRATLVKRGHYVSLRFLVEIGDRGYLVDIDKGRVASVQAGPFVMPSWTFALRASAEDWKRFFEPLPAPGFHDLFALLKARRLKVEGDLHPFMANLRYFKEILAAVREEINT
ncbi:hypothetical protein [Rhizobium wuzhouense]|uniref:SCP2 domain-containing protein n=1 Tax=Rhizobium wuzhouense TaxID=1986026 RepID=A0ABX5NP41_9HYPH|nr:hypothetical protein [Rhizobium wuzhouense]PYB72293.1 hypothetical protein DMY87_14175 [Rhizobium wuzhouense]